MIDRLLTRIKGHGCTVDQTYATLPMVLESLLNELQKRPDLLIQLAAAMVAACDTEPERRV